MKLNYRCFNIFAESVRRPDGELDLRVILQKIGTSKIALYHPPHGAKSCREAEALGIEEGKGIVDDIDCRRNPR